VLGFAAAAATGLRRLPGWIVSDLLVVEPDTGVLLSLAVSGRFRFLVFGLIVDVGLESLSRMPRETGCSESVANVRAGDEYYKEVLTCTGG
jgi:hypothetical protein